MIIQEADCICIFGKRKCGKSHLAREIAEVFPRQVTIDPVADWTNGEVVTTFEAFAAKLKEKYLNRENKFNIIFRFNPDEKLTTEIFNEILRLCYHIGGLMGGLQVIIDEVQMFCNPHFMPQYLKNLAFIGRHKKIGLICITQRPASVNKGLLSQSEHIFVGQLHDKNDLRAVADFIGDDTEKLISLPARNFIYFSPTYGKKQFSTEKK